MLKNKNGNVLINSLLALILASIILTSISTSTVGSYILQEKMYFVSKEIKEARIATQILIMDIENHLLESFSEYNYGTLSSFLIDYTSNDSFCTYNANDKYKDNANDFDVFPITCSVGDAQITTNIIVVDYAPSLYNYVLGTDGDLYLNGTSFIGGNSFAEELYITNHTLNGDSAKSLDEPISIKPLLDEPTGPRTHYNYVHFNKGLTIGTNIYTSKVNGCYADKINPCYTLDSINKQINLKTTTDVTSNMELYTHELNYGTELPMMKTDFNIDIPEIDLGAKVNEIIVKYAGLPSNKNYEFTIDPYLTPSSDKEEDLLCYTNIYNDKPKDNTGFDCRDTLLHNTNSNIISESNSLTLTTGYTDYDAYSLPNTIFSNRDIEDYQVTVNRKVTKISPKANNVLFIDGDLVINDMESSLELGGTIIVKGDVIINGNIKQLKLTGTIYSFGSIDINLTSTENGIINDDNEFGFLFAKEHIIINANRDFYGLDEDTVDYNMNGYFYADGSILIETDAYSSFNLNGGLYAKGNTDTRYPEITIDGYEFIFDGIMINSYSGAISNEYILDKNPFKSRFVVTPHKALDGSFQTSIDRIEIPTEFNYEIGPQDFITAYKEVQ